MRIVSRSNELEHQNERLREILEAVTDGKISSHGGTQPGTTLSELVTQVDEVFVDYMEHAENAEQAYENLHDENLALFIQNDQYERRLKSLTDGIPYDDALDNATIDFMDALLGSGAAATTFAGDLGFEDGVVFSKEDFKPLIRQAIDTWIQSKS